MLLVVVYGCGSGIFVGFWCGADNFLDLFLVVLIVGGRWFHSKMNMFSIKNSSLQSCRKKHKK